VLTQVDDGASPVGLDACELGYRVKGTTLGLLWTFRGDPMAGYQSRGAPGLCEKIAEAKLAVWARTYRRDEDVDPRGWQRAWALLSRGHKDSVCDDGDGGHHAFYTDDTVASISKFFRRAEKKRAPRPAPEPAAVAAPAPAAEATGKPRKPTAARKSSPETRPPPPTRAPPPCPGAATAVFAAARLSRLGKGAKATLPPLSPGSSPTRVAPEGAAPSPPAGA